jgi:hypothetical protein
LEERLSDEIEKAEAQKKENLKNTIGRILPPTREDLEKDKIARVRASNIILLYKLALNYKELSSLPATTALNENRVYPDETKLPRQLKILRQIFWSHANAPGLQFDRKEELTFDDPANSENLIILWTAQQRVRAVAASDKISLEIDAYVKQVSTIANDPLVSEGIERIPDPTLSSAASLSEKTKSYPVSVLRFGNFYLGSFEIPTFTECMKKWWKKKNADLYYGLPQCPNVTEPYSTTGDEKTETYEATKSQAVIDGKDEYLKKLAEANAVIEENRAKNMGDVPSNAPDWVRTYAEIYGTSNRGSLNYNGTQIIVGRAVGSTEEIAFTNARKLVTFPSTSSITIKEEYSYLSLTGYLVTFTNNSQQFIYPEDKEEFDNSSATVRVKSIVEQTEYVAYVQWA